MAFGSHQFGIRDNAIEGQNMEIDSTGTVAVVSSNGKLIPYMLISIGNCRWR